MPRQTFSQSQAQVRVMCNNVYQMTEKKGETPAWLGSKLLTNTVLDAMLFETQADVVGTEPEPSNAELESILM